MMRQRDLNLAALVEAATRAVDVGKSHCNAVDVVVGTVKREFKASLGVLAQSVGQIDSTGLDVDSHEADLHSR